MVSPDKPRALVVDDNEINRLVARAYLVKLGFQVSVVHSGEEALLLSMDAASGTFDVVLMDVHMPGVDGLETTRRYRAVYGTERPVILGVTAAATEGIKELCLRSGMNACLFKPLTLPALTTALSEHLGERAALVPGLASAAPSLGQALRKPHLLLIDDDGVSTSLLARRFEKEGFECTRRDGGQNIEADIEKIGPDLVLLDHHMPDVTGPEVLQRIRKIRAKEDLPVIMCTANEDPGDIVRALGDGACDYIVKPVNIAVAIARIRTHLSLRDAYRVHAKQDRIDIVRALIVTLSHEINNPLAIASGHLELIAAEGRLDPETQAQLTKVEHALDRIAKTILRARKLGRETEIEISMRGNDSPMVKI